MTSLCSVPGILRGLVPLETERQMAACRRHDARYEHGGDERARLIADLLFGLDLLGCDAEILGIVETALGYPDDGAMTPTWADRYVFSVRAHGASCWRG